ncbi:hypothetical protein BGX21_006857 [Mortierella sp. AD011]|nr:hypothetical protein BGX21_006857 [Mortierella sp. AD011]
MGFAAVNILLWEHARGVLIAVAAADTSVSSAAIRQAAFGGASGTIVVLADDDPKLEATSCVETVEKGLWSEIDGELAAEE